MEENPPTCFLCLKLSPLPNLKFEEEPVSLRTIHRYLNVPSQQNCGDGGGGGDSVWWWLCEQCAAVAGKLTDLCEQLEVIQMKVDHSLELFYTKLLEGEQEEHHHQSHQSKRLRGRDPNYKSFHKLRAQTLEQCERSLRHAKRLSVHLKKCRGASRTYEQSHSTSVPVIKTELEQVDDLYERPLIPLVLEPPVEEPMPFIPEPPPPPDPSPLLLKFLKAQPPPPPQIPMHDHHLRHSHSVLPSKQPAIQLISCPPPFLTPVDPDICSPCPQLAFALAPGHHLDQLLPSSSYRHPSEYKAYSDHVDVEIHPRRSLPLPPPPPQRRPSVISTGLDLSGTGKCCPDCGAEFARKNLIKRHQIESCPFRRDKSKSSRKPTECPDCGVTFLHPGSFYHHRKEKHPHKAASLQKPPNYFHSHFL